MVVISCPLCQTNVEIYQHEISQRLLNAKFGSNFNMPVVYYGQLISVADGLSAEEFSAGWSANQG